MECKTIQTIKINHLHCILLLLLMILPYLALSQINYSLSHLKAKNIGGKKEFKRILDQELIYPEKALSNNQEGKVTLCFVVTQESIVKELKVRNSCGDLLDREAMRVFNKLIWIPAFYQGNPISTFNCIDIAFSVKPYFRTCKKRGYDSISFAYNPIDSSNRIHEYKIVGEKPFPYFENQSTNIVSFFSKNIHYPETAIKNNISGTVIIRFVVEPNGMITNIDPFHPVAGGCSEETIRIVKMLKWYPGIDEGKAVRTWVDFSVNFKLTDQGKYMINPILVKGVVN